MARSDRYRLKFSFWLNILNNDEKLVSEQIEILKNDRSFASVCRDGIMLVSELRQGSSTLLVKLFDWLRAPLELYQSLIDGDTTMLFAQFPNIVPTPLPPPVSPEKIKEMDEELNRLRIEVNILREVLINQKLPNAIDTAVKMASVGEGAPVRTPRTAIAPKPAYVEPSPVVEADTSEAFLNGF